MGALMCNTCAITIIENIFSGLSHSLRGGETNDAVSVDRHAHWVQRGHHHISGKHGSRKQSGHMYARVRGNESGRAGGGGGGRIRRG